MLGMIIAVRSRRSLASESQGDSMARGYTMIEQCLTVYDIIFIQKNTDWHNTTEVLPALLSHVRCYATPEVML